MMLTDLFLKVRSHAAKNYERDGWDMFYECVDFADFQETCKEMNLDTYEKIFEEYKQRCELWAERREEQRAMADEGW